MSNHDWDVYMFNFGKFVFGVWNGLVIMIILLNVYNDGAWYYLVVA